MTGLYTQLSGVLNDMKRFRPGVRGFFESNRQSWSGHLISVAVRASVIIGSCT